MRSFSWFLFFTVAALSLCSCRNHPPPESNFFRDFALVQIVERVKAPELIQESASTGASTSYGETTQGRREFNLVFKIEEQEGAKFDEAGFVNKLNTEAQRFITEAGLHVHGGGRGKESFHVDFSEGEHDDWLEVHGMRAEGKKYCLWGLIRETTRKPKEER